MQLFSCIKVHMDKVFKALADSSRRKILDHLHANNGQTLNELCERHYMSRQTVSKNLLILEKANLVTTRREVMKSTSEKVWQAIINPEFARQ